MIENSVSKLSISSQCDLLEISRSCYYYKHSGESELNQHLMRLIDEQFMMTPCYGSRQMSDHLKRYGYKLSKSGIVFRYYLYPYEEGFFIPCRCYGLVQQKSIDSDFCVAALEEVIAE